MAESVQIRAYFRNKEHSFTLSQPSYSNLTNLRDEIFAAFLPEFIEHEDEQSNIVSRSEFQLKYLQNSQLSPLYTNEQWQKALQVSLSQQPSFLHIFLLIEETSLLEKKEYDIDPALIPLPEDIDDELIHPSLSNSSSLSHLLESYFHSTPNESKQEESSAPSSIEIEEKMNVGSSNIVFTEKALDNAIPSVREADLDSFEPEKSPVAEPLQLKVNKAVQSTPLAGFHSKTFKTKTSSSSVSPIPWNPSVNAKDLRNPEYETKLSLIDERSSPSPTKLSFIPLPLQQPKRKKKSNPTSSSSPSFPTPSQDFKESDFLTSSSFSSVTETEEHASTSATPNEAGVHVNPSRPPLAPIIKSNDHPNHLLFFPTKPSFMETIREDDTEQRTDTLQSGQQNRSNPHQFELFKENSSDMDLDALEKYLSTLSSNSSSHVPSQPRTHKVSFHTSCQSQDMDSESHFYPSTAKPVLKSNLNKGLHTMSGTPSPPPAATGPSHSTSVSDPPTKSILKKVSIVVDPLSSSSPTSSSPSPIPTLQTISNTLPVGPSSSSLELKKPDPALPNVFEPTLSPTPTPSPTPFLSSTTATPPTTSMLHVHSDLMVPSPYVLVPTHLLPSLFPVLPPIPQPNGSTSFPLTPTSSVSTIPSTRSSSVLEQKYGLPPRPKSMVEYTSYTKYGQPPRPYSATPPPLRSYYEQYLLSRK